MKKGKIVILILVVLLVAGAAAFFIKTPKKIEEFAAVAGTTDDITIPDNVKIVALGEAAHGCKEFQELKLEVFQKLVESTSIRALILEGDMGGCALANNYIQGGEGSAEDMTRVLGYRLYRTDQMCQLVQWMHDYNQTAAEDDKVRLYGMDIQKDMNAVRLIKETYAKLDEEKGRAYGEKMDALLGTEEDAYDKSNIDGIMALMDEISGDINDNKDAYAQKVPMDQLQILDRATFAIKSSVDYYENQKATHLSRDTKMMENVEWALELEEQLHQSGLMLASHNGHMTKNQSTQVTFLGKFLYEKYQDAYFAIGTDYYNAEINLPKNGKRVNVKFNSSDALAYQAKDFPEGRCYVDFASVPADGTLGKMIHSPMRTGSMGEDYSFMYKVGKIFSTVNCAPADMYDAMIFYYQTTPTVIWED